MRLWWMIPGLALLAGCQATPTTLPSAEPRPAAECRWEAGDVEPREWVRRALDALEAEDFVVRDTELALGWSAPSVPGRYRAMATVTTAGSVPASLAVWVWAAAGASPPV
ncbi:hypothetical protein EKK97_21670 [Billgrantia tianxiuensis]|uniref:Lipoprotein n=1 Tax=Billgrantia tianxiuensis TaxID=2497861 RepID=A0A6I6SPA0_9GAMM|nr:hypothetical protein [Halomonas tianxiuensis]QHC51692.1 hypothetical protein EKK97_21670 [Halomonas tianxiuensis]